ncbi:cAMP-binding domain of CRP or a regulatory subunit of cAMP-dependent protein kinases [Ruminococcus flavefaciens]|jgi:CRP-like cAMP-binding protein|uniref:cAMP-binding domain of CRP or a regulatory subunit of cAMP-dependent protein kinases n=1 Tax=Ruminococcus flavefaciens TaxID=1265 RepID=A0A1H6LLB3_RUMFL|nr:Crp/Fnr family transcriptional regulator [Ruminococcus flavefaciens]SEH85439.1 cAMP-binding domain of CRP or a regulatory subunit of cAMP-dependent protein kinases [Ruminococcus flavefaciens]
MDISVLSGSALFNGFDETEVNNLLGSLNAREKRFRKGAMIFHSGDVISTLCFVITGSVTIESNDMWGNRTILNLVSKGQFFAESYALLPDEPMLVDVCANEDCTIVYLDMKSLGGIDDNSRARLLANLLMITTRKNLHLSSRSFHTAPRQVRGRIMAYLNTVSVQKNSREFDIPFDRQQLADYLNVERSVLSNELSKMQKDGLIRCRKNHFEIM